MRNSSRLADLSTDLPLSPVERHYSLPRARYRFVSSPLSRYRVILKEPQQQSTTFVWERETTGRERYFSVLIALPGFIPQILCARNCHCKRVTAPHVFNSLRRKGDVGGWNEKRCCGGGGRERREGREGESEGLMREGGGAGPRGGTGRFLLGRRKRKEKRKSKRF